MRGADRSRCAVIFHIYSGAPFTPFESTGEHDVPAIKTRAMQNRDKEWESGDPNCSLTDGWSLSGLSSLF
jgi:hypothetical protein